MAVAVQAKQRTASVSSGAKLRASALRISRTASEKRWGVAVQAKPRTAPRLAEIASSKGAEHRPHDEAASVGFIQGVERVRRGCQMQPQRTVALLAQGIDRGKPLRISTDRFEVTRFARMASVCGTMFRSC